MTEKLLLHIVYECQRHRVALPWNAIAHRFHPGSSGTAVNQHIQRLRKDLIAEGHLVPPPTGKSANEKAFDNELRGYIRADLESHDRETVRPVLFDEVMDDRKFNLPDAFDMEDDEPGSFGESDSEDQYEDHSDSIESPLQRRGKGSAGLSPRTRPTTGHQNTRRPQVIDDEEHGIESFEEASLCLSIAIAADADELNRESSAPI
ncbi:hypothetical protein N3K66_002639 [Trichothecium roseum]|uniref:Uncharacterized protein n=1 Tax=Trichothecium roseum TaxID=47278 RepID=A0ACC0VA63_9HYPO|nr:hypothetical protein N3K66_002639 [Trichothecium roseum]